MKRGDAIVRLVLAAVASCALLASLLPAGDPTHALHMAVVSSAAFSPVVDPYVNDLANGRPPAEDVYGFDIAALWRKESIPELEKIQDQYNKIATKIASIPGAQDAAYIYPFAAFHCTVAALVKVLLNSSRTIPLRR
eukprot:SAG31_NODE_5962_length_2236_cov_1.543753_4_plen_137_part_00